MSGKPGKVRPGRALTPQEKLSAIQRVHGGGESKASVARDLGVPESTLRGWCKNENKISYQSRQSSPDENGSPGAAAAAAAVAVAEPRAKRQRSEEPYNLSMKPRNSRSPVEIPKSTPLLSESERNRAELARLTVQLGLNCPERYTGPPVSILTPNDLQMWQNILHRDNNRQREQVTAPANATAANLIATNIEQSKPSVSTSNIEDVYYNYLKMQSMFAGIPSSHPALAAGSAIIRDSLYRAANLPATNTPPTNSPPSNPLPTPEVPQEQILYQQLTRNQTRSHSEGSATTKKKKSRSLLDHYLFKNANINNNNDAGLSENRNGVVPSQCEAIEHGEKFLEWLETYTHPSISTSQIMHFRVLLRNCRSINNKNGISKSSKPKRK